MSPSGEQASSLIEPTFAKKRKVDFLRNCSSSSLHYRQQLMKNRTIHNQLANNVEVPLDHNALGDLRWWVDSLSLANGHPMRISLPHLVIQSDAFNTGWGAVSNGKKRVSISTVKGAYSITMQDICVVGDSKRE